VFVNSYLSDEEANLASDTQGCLNALELIVSWLKNTSRIS
jgi:hypothetical protein